MLLLMNNSIIQSFALDFWKIKDLEFSVGSPYLKYHDLMEGFKDQTQAQ